VDSIVRGTWRPPSFVKKLISGKRDQGDRGDLPSLCGKSRRVPGETWWPIYTPHPGHFEFAGVAEHPTHTLKHLQAIQEHSDHILMF